MISSGGAAVRIDGLMRHFGDVRAVDGVSFTFGPGDIFGFVGPNGAGKTTTMRILSTLDVPDAGDARVGGFSVVDDADRVRPLVGFMPDHLGVYSNLTVGEYLDFFARAYGLRGERRREAIRSIVEFTDLGPLCGKMCESLSKGMRQRLGLARTLIHDPQVLVLDEPAAALDPRARIEFRELLAELARRGKAILISSHILTELSEICNSVAIIERGRVLATGTIEEIRGRLGPRTVLRIGLVDRHEEALRTLQVYPGIEAARATGREIEAEFRGDAAARAELLRRLVEGGFAVTQFAGKEENLEDLFMRITAGGAP